jgi:hypothetical protein
VPDDVGRTPDELFDGFPDTLALYEHVRRVMASIGPVTVRVTRSQVAFRHRKGFAYFWRPGQYVHNDVPAVLSIALSRELSSDRIKEVAHPSPDVWMHHGELRTAREIDQQVRAWLDEAYAGAA